MKKLYYLDESEKDRILNLHNKHKGNLLNEQAPYEIQQDGGGWTDSAKTQFNAKLNNFGTGRGAFTTGIIDFCKKEYDKSFPKGPSLELSDIQKLTSNITSAARKGSISTFGVTNGRGMSEDAVKEFVTNLQAFNNMANVCYSVANISTRGTVVSGYENIFDTFDEIYANEGNYGYKNAILENLKYLAGKTKVIVDDATNLDACLKVNKNLTNKEGSPWYSYTVQGRIYNYAVDGDWYSTDTNTENRDPKTVKTYYKFTCDKNNKIIHTIDKTKNVNVVTAEGGGGGGDTYPVAEGHVFNSAMPKATLDAIRAKTGSRDTGTMLTQNDINLINSNIK